MPALDQHWLSFLIRWIHVISMAFLLGGVLLLYALIVDAKRREHNRWLAQVAVKYESLFWMAIGVQVITGIGNIGSFGSGLPGVASAWGAKLLLKLILVLVFVFLSLVRTLITTRLDFDLDTLELPQGTSALQGVYGISALFLGVIVLMAEALAHG